METIDEGATVGAERVAFFHRLLHAYAIAQREQPVDAQLPPQALVLWRHGGEQRVEPCQCRVRTLEAAGGLGWADVGAPSDHRPRLLGGDRSQ